MAIENKYLMIQQNLSNQSEPIKTGCCGVGMFAVILFFLMLTIFCSCSTTRRSYSSEHVRVDSIVIVNNRIDTVTIQLDKEHIVIYTPTDSAYAETAYAEAYARVSDIGLFLELRNKDIEIKKAVIVRDSFIYVTKDKEVATEITKEVLVEKKLSWWQSLKLELGGICLGALILLIIYLGIKIYTTVTRSGWGAVKTLFKL